MNGPVPLAFSDAWPSCLFLKSSGRAAPCFSLQARLMICTVLRCCRKIGFTCASRNSTVSASSCFGSPSALA